MLFLDQKFLEFIENLNEGIWIIDADANTTFVNTRMAEMLGYTPNEMIGKHLFYFMDEAVVESAKNNLQRRAQGLRENLRFEFKHKNGREVITSLNTYPLMQNDGKYNGALAAITDITERKDLGKIVHQLEIKFKSIFDYASIGLAILSKDMQILDANDNFCEKLQYSKDEILNIGLLSIILPENKSEVLDNIDKLIDGTSDAFMAEYKFIRKKGSIGWGFTNYFAVKEGKNKEIKIIFSLRDITEKKNIEYELIKSEALFRNVLEHSDAAITICDRELRSLYANSSAFDQFGKKREAVPPRRHMCEGLPNLSGYYEKWEKRVLDCFSSGIAYQYSDVDQIGSNSISSESYTNPIRDEKGNIFAVAIFFRDVTKRKQIEKESHEQEKFAVLGKMAAHLSHEIRSPLASISMNVDLLSKNLKLGERQQKSFEIIDEEIKRLNHLLKEILSFSGEFHLNKMNFDIKEAIENIYSIFKASFKCKNIKFVNSVNSQIIHADADKIKSVFICLIENSMEAIDNNGDIKVYSHCISNDNIFELFNDNIFEFFIKDSGCGLENNAKLFDPFYTTKEKGTGLGLPIAKNIIEKHGGTINLVSSRPGETIFKINLPINEKNNQ